MTLSEFRALKVGDKVKQGHSARVRTVEFVYEEKAGGIRIVNLSRIKGVDRSINNFEYDKESHYSKKWIAVK